MQFICCAKFRLPRRTKRCGKSPKNWFSPQNKSEMFSIAAKLIFFVCQMFFISFGCVTWSCHVGCAVTFFCCSNRVSIKSLEAIKKKKRWKQRITRLIFSKTFYIGSDCRGAVCRFLKWMFKIAPDKAVSRNFHTQPKQTLAILK